jgi:hypothetical protein
MTTKTWNGSSADWYADSGGDWSPPGDPGSGDSVVINSGEVELLSGAAAFSVASLTVTGGTLAIQDPGKTQSVSGAVSVSGAGSLELDGAYIGGAGGSALTIGGNLTNSGTNSNGVDVGNTGISSADTLTVNGTGGLTNAGGSGINNGSQINIEGSAGVQATLNVANAAAGFGTAGTETGTVFLENDALLEFKSGEITAVDGELYLDGAKSRVADSTGTTTNSALTGLTSIPGWFFLENGASVAPTGNVSVTGNGSLELDGAYTGGAGGSALTIGGNLSNSGTNNNGVDVGNTGISSADTLTVNGTGGLTNSGDITIEGSSEAAGNLVVTDTATNSSGGTINLGSYGKLTAGALDITGGTVEGTGTIGKVVNVTGGTIVGGTLSSTTGTLTVSGVYNQSETGVLQTDIDTSLTQQSSVIAVSGSPGTPGSSGSVNLSGGTLLIDGLSALTLNTPYTVMTFGDNHLYGQFAKVETEGALGSHTGNGDSVNLGDGDTLEVLYNEASGQVQVEVVARPSSTTYTWDVGAGTWNASSGADWKPPGNGATPSATSNVTIGAGSGGTVTLTQDETIASLSLTKGYTLSGAYSITTTGNVSVATGATLSVEDMNVGGSFTDSGSATFAGAVTLNGSSKFTLSSGALSGGIDGSGTFADVAGTTNTLKNVTVYGGATFLANNTSTVDVSGSIVDDGVIELNGGGGTSGTIDLTGATTLSGAGVVTLTTTTGGGDSVIEGAGETLTISGGTIQGTGIIGDGTLAVDNSGTIDADSSAGIGTLTLNGTGAFTNAKVLEASSGGSLLIGSLTINNSGGTIAASGGTVQLDGTTVEGGALSTSGGGTLTTPSGDTTTLNGSAHGALTINAGSAYTAGAGSATDILGAIADKGSILVSGGGGKSGDLNLTAATTLSGGGTVTLTTTTGGDAATIEGSGETLTNSGDTIQGTGVIGGGSLALANGGTIDANSSAGIGTLTLNGTGGITNTGVLEATSGGHLIVDSALSGAGQLEIGASSEVELGVASSENATFESATSAKLRIDKATTTAYTGTLESFAKGDILELGNTDATSATATFNSVPDTTTLTVNLSGGSHLLYTLAGNLSADTFSVTHVNGGVDSDVAITATPAIADAISLLRDPIGSNFINLNNVPDSSTSGRVEFGLAGSPNPHS